MYTCVYISKHVYTYVVQFIVLWRRPSLFNPLSSVRAGGKLQYYGVHLYNQYGSVSDRHAITLLHMYT